MRKKIIVAFIVVTVVSLCRWVFFAHHKPVTCDSNSGDVFSFNNACPKTVEAKD